jgi:phage shock protein A
MAARKQQQTNEAALNTLEQLGRFQVENDRKLESLEKGYLKCNLELEKKVGALTDLCEALRADNAKLREEHREVMHRLAQTENEVVTSLKVTVEQAKKATEAAQVYERIRDAQPDTDALVQALRRETGGVSHRLLVLEEHVNTLIGKFDGLSAGLVEVQADTRVHQTLLSPNRPRPIES